MIAWWWLPIAAYVGVIVGIVTATLCREWAEGAEKVDQSHG